MSFHNLIENGIARVYSEDMKSQKFIIDSICKDIRNMKSDIVYQAKGFVVPNENYMLKFFGEDCLNLEYNLYDFEGNCNWQEHLVFPIRNLGNRIVGLVGYNFITKLRNEKTQDWSQGYYKYSSKSVFDRGKYIYIFPEIYEKAVKEGYLILVDGIFDKLSLVAHGYNAAALMGSIVNSYIITYLKFIPKLYLAVDNDDAGIKLYKTLKMYLPQLQLICQNQTKDMDDFLKTDKADVFKNILNESIKNKTKLDLILRF